MKSLEESKQIWNIGGGIQNFEFLCKFFKAIKGTPTETNFSVFDCPPELCWQGGRLSKPLTNATLDVFTCGALEQYSKFGVGVNLVFSNGMITKRDLNDERGNWILSQLHNENNGVILKSWLLAEYVRKNYPKFKITYSMTHGHKLEVDYYKDLLSKYEVVVLSNEQLDNEFLSGFTLEERARLEILVNENCFKGCPHRNDHYGLIDYANHNKDEEVAYICRKFCSLNKQRLLSNPLAFQSSNVTFERMIELREMGFCRWKLAGRTADPTQKVSPLFLNDFSNFVLRDLGIDPAFTYIYLLDNSNVLEDAKEVREWMKKL